MHYELQIHTILTTVVSGKNVVQYQYSIGYFHSLWLAMFKQKPVKLAMLGQSFGASQKKN